MPISPRDAEILRNVQLEVNWVPSLRQEHVEVTVKDGVATLSGTVGSIEQVRAAERAVRKVPGVTGISERIDLRPGTGSARRDDDLRRRAIESLRRNIGHPTRAIAIRITDGWITVDGEAEDQVQRDAVELSLAALFGAAGVSNHLTVRPAVDEEDVRRHIEDALRRTGKRESGPVKITISGRTVILEGSVTTMGERLVIEDAARGARGVSQVELHIKVAG